MTKRMCRGRVPRTGSHVAREKGSEGKQDVQTATEENNAQTHITLRSSVQYLTRSAPKSTAQTRMPME